MVAGTEKAGNEEEDEAAGVDVDGVEVDPNEKAGGGLAATGGGLFAAGAGAVTDEDVDPKEKPAKGLAGCAAAAEAVGAGLWAGGAEVPPKENDGVEAGSEGSDVATAGLDPKAKPEKGLAGGAAGAGAGAGVEEDEEPKTKGEDDVVAGAPNENPPKGEAAGGAEGAAAGAAAGVGAGGLDGIMVSIITKSVEISTHSWTG